MNLSDFGTLRMFISPFLWFSPLGRLALRGIWLERASGLIEGIWFRGASGPTGYLTYEFDGTSEAKRESGTSVF